MLLELAKQGMTVREMIAIVRRPDAVTPAPTFAEHIERVEQVWRQAREYSDRLREAAAGEGDALEVAAEVQKVIERRVWEFALCYKATQYALHANTTADALAYARYVEGNAHAALRALLDGPTNLLVCVPVELLKPRMRRRCQSVSLPALHGIGPPPPSSYAYLRFGRLLSHLGHAPHTKHVQGLNLSLGEHRWRSEQWRHFASRCFTIHATIGLRQRLIELGVRPVPPEPQIFLKDSRALAQAIRAFMQAVENTIFEIEASPEYVTLSQISGHARLSKKTLERWCSKGELPAADVKGGGGKSALWKWASVRPYLEKAARRQVPIRFPSPLSGGKSS